MAKENNLCLKRRHRKNVLNFEKRIFKIMFFLNRSIFSLLTVAFLIFLSTANAGIELSGTLGAMTISSDGNPFIVKENIIIPQNNHVTINKGCQLFFMPHTGITVEGSLSIEGTGADPVIFTSIYDSLYPEKTENKAKPFDWNGIIISNHSQKILLKNFIIKYSIYGIESYNSNMSIDSGIFIGNGQFNFTVNNKILPVHENISFCFNNEKPKTIPKKGQTDITKPLLPTAKVTTITGLAALCFMTYYLHQKDEFVSLYRAAKSQKERDEYYERQKPLSRNAMISGLVGGVMLSTGGVLLFLDHNQKKKKNISLRPIIGPGNGISLSIDF
jgi:hypothetical protein